MGKKHTSGSNPAGFTLVETLASISIVSVLLAVMLPALRGARESAAGVRCQASMATITQIQHLYQADHDGLWPNAFGNRGGASWTVGQTYTSAHSVFSQVRGWLGPLHQAGRVDASREIEALSCPTAARQVDDKLEANPQIAAMFSYGYSPALFTKAALWDPDQPDRRAEPDAWRSRVRGSSVVFPANKVSMFEIADYHGQQWVIGADQAPAEQRSTVAFADGHVGRRLVGEAQAALPLDWNELYGSATPDALPFASSAWGHQGRVY